MLWEYHPLFSHFQTVALSLADTPTTFAFKEVREQSRHLESKCSSGTKRMPSSQKPLNGSGNLVMGLSSSPG